MSFKHAWYIERDGHVAPAVDLEEWSVFMNDNKNKRVDRTDLPWGGWVSTVFLGIDHSLEEEGPPVLYESMVFADMEMQDMDTERYCTRDEAKAGHEQMVQKWQTNPPAEAP